MDLEKILEHINLGQMDSSGYGFANWLSTSIGKAAIELKQTLYVNDKYGFLNCSVDEFVDEACKNSRKVYDGGKRSKVYITDESMLSIEDNGEKSINSSFVSTSESETKVYTAAAKKYIEKTKKNTVSVLTQSMDGFYLTPIGTLSAPLVRENYIDEVVNSFDFVAKDFQSRNPFGRLVIVNGPPGTGKTFYLRGLINELDNSTVVLMPPRMLSEIDGPTLLPTFINERSGNSKSITLIIEDADACLAERMNDNISSISALLNHTDGILGTLLDLRIIATTNQKSINFDEALTRPGRLSRHIEIQSLPSEKATEVYKRLTEDDEFKFPAGDYTLADIYAKAMVKADGELIGVDNNDNYDSNPGSRIRRGSLIARRMGF